MSELALPPFVLEAPAPAEIGAGVPLAAIGADVPLAAGLVAWWPRLAAWGEAVAAVLVPPAVAAPPVPDDPSLAMGLSGVGDASAEQPFLDVMKTARPWTGHLRGQYGGMDEAALDAGGWLDADGWLRAMPAEISGVSTYVFTDQSEGAASLKGRYRLSYQGSGRFDLDGRVANVVRKPGEIWFDYAPGAGFVVLTITATDPAGTGDYLRNFALVKSDNIELRETGAIFNPVWLDRIRDLRAVRFMDWMQTNNSTIADWSERPQPADYTYARRGVPLEVMVELANEIGADPWFNMPHRATDGYARAFADYVRDHLEPRRKAYVEYSNEVWNWQFAQAGWAADRARARWGAAAGGDAWMQFAGMRAAAIAQIWTDSFGAATPDRLIRVIATQTGWLGLEAPLLEAPLWVAEDPSTHAPPAAAFDAYAITGYFSARLGAEAAPEVRAWLAEGRRRGEIAAGALRGAAREAAVTEAAVAAAMPRAVAALAEGPQDSVGAYLGETLPYHARVAATHGLDLVMYEGGTHVVGIGAEVDDPDLQAFFLRLNYSAEMGALYRRLLAGWQRHGRGPFNAFVDVAGPSKWGSWGALRHLDDDNPRWQALMAANCTVPAWWETRAPGSFEDGVLRQGGPGAEVIEGGPRADILLGRGGDDRLSGGGGDDRIHGGAGSDTVVLPGDRRNYVFSRDGSAVIAAGPVGRLRLVAVEAVEFSEPGSGGRPLALGKLARAD